MMTVLTYTNCVNEKSKSPPSQTTTFAYIYSISLHFPHDFTTFTGQMRGSKKKQGTKGDRTQALELETMEEVSEHF